MASIFMSEKSKYYTRKDAVKIIRRLEKSGKKHTLHNFAKLYDGDFEEAFREAVGKVGIETYAYDLERHITRGAEWAGDYTNNLQRDIWDFKVYSLVLYMKDRELKIPLSLLDNELVDELNMASNDFGDDILYIKYNPLRICINPSKKVDLGKFGLSEEEHELIEVARKERAAYIENSEKIDEEKIKSEREEIDYGEVPHWMKVVHDKFQKECEG